MALVFLGLRNRWKLSISMEFATESTNAVLFYNGRYSEKRDFIAIRIRGGQAELAFSLGETQVVVPSYVEGGVSDGSWHKVVIGFENKVGSVVSYAFYCFVPRGEVPFIMYYHLPSLCCFFSTSIA